ncbi:Protein esc1 [Tolypocladium capitatum]|uniref:Protein esc1 n=1 Tax=Tolypocladium capitatum TaxID=45235 RepID=A0A2K3QI06_9HYPO|nr:Protein esc1 [Tolypocladium capitatum]
MATSMETQFQHQHQHRPSPAKAAGLTNILNKDDHPPTRNAPPHQLRDSGFYSTAEASSKHTSTASFSINGLSPAGSGYQSSSVDKTPSPVASNLVPQALASPSATNMSVASMVSPASPDGIDQRRFDRPTSLESQGQNGAALGENLAGGAAATRRESVDGPINQGFSDMRLGGSPYTSNNQSTSSIQNTLHSQRRNPRPGLEALSVHRISNGYQPSAERNPEPKTIKTAPAITGPATGHIARAAEPTKGQAWAFPEEEIQRVPPPGRYDDSRRSSITESIASSQFTTESRLPPGQRRLDDGPDLARVSQNSAEFPPMHHHTMQHKQLSDLQAEEGNLPAGAQPYSRTPELRVSHKLAERKRRTEMKELFDQLRDLMPQERGSKASKWEILTKAIAEHQRQTDHIRLLQSHYNTTLAENEMLRREMHGLRMDGAHSAGHAQQGPSQPPQQSSQSGSYAADSYANSNRTELPPLRSISNNIPNGPDSMTGVQYEAPRVNGYRPERY